MPLTEAEWTAWRQAEEEEEEEEEEDSPNLFLGTGLVCSYSDVGKDSALALRCLVALSRFPVVLAALVGDNCRYVHAGFAVIHLVLCFHRSSLVGKMLVYSGSLPVDTCSCVSPRDFTEFHTFRRLHALGYGSPRAPCIWQSLVLVLRSRSTGSPIRRFLVRQRIHVHASPWGSLDEFHTFFYVWRCRCCSSSSWSLFPLVWRRGKSSSSWWIPQLPYIWWSMSLLCSCSSFHISTLSWSRLLVSFWCRQPSMTHSHLLAVRGRLPS